MARHHHRLAPTQEVARFVGKGLQVRVRADGAIERRALLPGGHRAFARWSAWHRNRSLEHIYRGLALDEVLERLEGLMADADGRAA